MINDVKIDNNLSAVPDKSYLKTLDIFLEGDDSLFT
jgi:hypothetical protein